MIRTMMSCAALLWLTIPASAQMSAAPTFSPDQKGYIVYNQCMMHAAIRASHTDAKDEEIFRLAKENCKSIRAQIVVGQEDNRQFIAALDAADVEKAANFPAWIKGVRERRKAFGAGAGSGVSTTR